MREGHSNTWPLFVGVVSLVFATSVYAQTDDEINGAVQFNFSTPGARSLALGGAFLGLANDATAAFTNPAGLTQLSELEVSIEGRQFDYSSPYVWGGRAPEYGPASGFGLDAVEGLIFRESNNEIKNVSFASFVYAKGGRWAFAVYTHRLADFEANFETQGAFHGTSAGGDFNRVLPIRAIYDLDVSNTGASLAFRLGKSFSIGLGASSYSFDLKSLTQRFAVGFEDIGGGVLSPVGPPDFDTPGNFQTQIGDGDDTGFNVGFLWKVGEKFSIGGVYRQGPGFDLEVRSVSGSPEMESFVDVEETIQFNIPDIFGLGLAIEPTESLTITFDWDRITYSDMTDDFVIFFGRDEVTEDEFVIDDADELHLGIEYVFSNLKLPFAIRFGAWHDPDHKLRFEGERRTSRIRLFEGGDEFHYSVGFGLVFGGSFQLDAAADFSDLFDVVSLSAVYRF